MIRMVLDTEIRKGQINKNIYGHFSEHLGRCIYGGFGSERILHTEYRRNTQ